MPENAVALTVAESGWLYQVVASGGRDGATVAVGEEVSTFRGKLIDSLDEPHHTWHETVVMTSVYFVERQPTTCDGTGLACHVTGTGPFCQSPDWSHGPFDAEQ